MRALLEQRTSRGRIVVSYGGDRGRRYSDPMTVDLGTLWDSEQIVERDVLREIRHYGLRVRTDADLAAD